MIPEKIRIHFNTLYLNKAIPLMVIKLSYLLELLGNSALTAILSNLRFAYKYNFFCNVHLGEQYTSYTCIMEGSLEFKLQYNFIIGCTNHTMNKKLQKHNSAVNDPVLHSPTMLFHTGKRIFLYFLPLRTLCKYTHM